MAEPLDSSGGVGAGVRDTVPTGRRRIGLGDGLPHVIGTAVVGMLDRRGRVDGLRGGLADFKRTVRTQERDDRGAAVGESLRS